MIEQTLAIIKPDAVNAGNTGKIIDMIEANGFNIDRIEKGILRKELAQLFYEAHKDKPFFGELVDLMTSGPIIVMLLRKENAISDWRTLMGSTDSKKAAPGTVRHAFGTDIGKNAVHGSDSAENAVREITLFFGQNDVPESDDECCGCGCS